MGGEVVSAGLNFVPIVGEAKSLTELATGKDFVTGQELSAFDRSVCAVGCIPVVGKLARVRTVSSLGKLTREGRIISKCEKVGEISNYKSAADAVYNYTKN